MKRPYENAAAEAPRGMACMVGGGLLLGTIGVFVQEAGQDPATTVLFRCLFGGLALLCWGLLKGRLLDKVAANLGGAGEGPPQ